MDADRDASVHRLQLPRGLTMMIDPGLPTGLFRDVVASFAVHLDFVKFGWGTALVTPGIDEKIEALRDAGVAYFFGGTLFEHQLRSGCLEGFLAFVRSKGCGYLEISNGTIPLNQHDKAEYVARLAGEFTVLAEVGLKDVGRAEAMSATQWVDAIGEDLAAGASYVITEARESGRSGMAGSDGRLRSDILAAVLEAVPTIDVIFEAPTKDLQVELIGAVGAAVNLGNIAWSDVIGLETLRAGLRGDTLLDLVPGVTDLAPCRIDPPASARHFVA